MIVTRRARRRTATIGAVLVGGGTILAGGLEVWGPAPAGPGLSWWRDVATAVLLAASLAVPIAAAAAATSRRPLMGRRWRRRVPAHATAALVAMLAGGLAEGAAHALVPWSGTALAPSVFAEAFAWYTLWAVVLHAVELARRLRHAREVRLHVLRVLERARREQAATQLRAVKNELHPVLIANALATARSLVTSDPAAAERVIVELGQLMREAVAGAGMDAVTLGEEVDAARDRGAEWEGGDARAEDIPGLSRVSYHVDEDVRDAVLPHLVVPSLLACAEEAGWAAGRARLHARRVVVDSERWLELAVHARARRATPRDAPPRSRGGSTAAAALGRLLHQFYGPDVRWQLQHGVGDDGAPSVCLRLPLLADDETAASVPGRVAFDEWVAATTSDAVPARRGAADVWAVAGVGALLVAAEWSFSSATFHAGWDAGIVLFLTAAFGLTLACVCAVAIATARHWPVGVDDRLGRAVRAHVAAGLGVATLAIGVRAAARSATRWMGVANVAPLTAGEIVSRIAGLFALYVVFVTIAHLAVLGRERRRTAQVVDRARAARRSYADRRRHHELRALKAELNPHFVGNALHTAAALVRSTPEAADQLLAALGELVTDAGTRIDVQEVSLLEEVAGLDPFLALERARLGAAGGSLAVTWDVAPEVTGAAVPHLILQPLVENAVRHGLAPRGGVGRLTIRAGLLGTRLEIAVVDDGVGVRGAQRHPPTVGTRGVGSGAGLRGVRQRLALLYGGTAATCVLEPAPSGGTVARITLPYRQIVAAGDEHGDAFAAAGG
ncbi:hypothetical protein tb265_49590 [Gemmatimonadetes bacterium T265]|nr:hypothetical protein tb265_49590 [Gemmatimonadetes bacterium T265]